MRYCTSETPFGEVLIVGDDDGLKALDFRHNRRAASPGPDWVEASRDSLLREARSQLSEYFDGRRRRFELPLNPDGTPFQRRVWKALGRIPFGRTRTYGELARAIGRTGAFRAVGAANGRNPIAIVIPCHRLIGANGSLTGYGGGLEVKKALLAHEGAL